MTETVTVHDFTNGAISVASGALTGNIQFYPNWGDYTTNWPYSTVQYIQQTFCAGDIHVFGCSHAEKCKCGKASRKVEPPKCAYCGKAHA